MDADRMKRKDRARLPESKRRRLFLKEERSTSKGGNEAIEGLSYQSGLSFDSYRHFFTIISVWTSLYIIYTISVLEIGLSVKEEDIEKIPDPVPKPSFSSSSNLKNCSAPSVVILDLETTGLSKYFFLKYLKKRKEKKAKLYNQIQIDYYQYLHLYIFSSAWHYAPHHSDSCCEQQYQGAVLKICGSRPAYYTNG